MGCYKTVSRSVPLNYILLGIFTLAEAYMVSAITVFYNPQIILVAVVLTAAVVVSLTIYAFVTDTDFTMLGGIFFVCAAVLLVGAILAFFIRNRPYTILISVLSTILFGLYLIYDTQLILGNKENKFNLDDYCFAAISLYIDIVTIFLNILSIIGGK